MNFIQRFFLKRYIADNKNVRKPEVISLRDAKNVGILCNITTEDSYKDIYAVFSHLQSAKRSVWLMGYIYRKLSLLQTETPVAKGKKGVQKDAYRTGSAFLTGASA